MVGTILVVVVFLGLIGVAYLMCAKLGLLKSGRSDAVEATPSDPRAAVPYRARSRLLSPAEGSFHSVLRQSLPILTAEAGKDEMPLLFAKVRLADILSVDRGAAGGEGAGAQNRINSKHADFVLCAPDTTRPLILIELDDASHEHADRKKRDEFVDRAAAAAGIPVLHVKAAATYQPRALASAIMSAMVPRGEKE